MTYPLLGLVPAVVVAIVAYALLSAAVADWRARRAAAAADMADSDDEPVDET